MRDIVPITSYVKERMSGEATGHDWFHVERVYTMATKIAKEEKNVDLFIVQAAALLHDLGDWKVNTSGQTEEAIILGACHDLGISAKDAQKIGDIIVHMSFSKNIGKRNRLSLEGKIVQDADRLEALGAIGIARAFAYGGKKNRLLYDPNVPPNDFTSTGEYRDEKKNARNHTINHFYEKLFTLRKLLNTRTAKQIALQREKFMKAFLKEFYAEWEGSS